MKLAVGEDLLAEVLATLHRCGGERDECVAYLSGPLTEPRRVDAMLHPVHEARPDHYEIAPAWLNETWLALARQRRTIRMQVHTHGGEAFHSVTDDSFPLIQTVGFLSLVVPDFARRGDLSGAYLAELRSDGSFVEVPVDDSLVIGR